ncbi:MAG: hypothetical protein ACRDXE_10540 [Acidimicrobiales bacterium]
MHLIRETAAQAGHVHVKVACSDSAWRLPTDRPVASFATGFWGRVTCEGCKARPVPFAFWRRDSSGHVVDFGRIEIPPPLE